MGDSISRMIMPTVESQGNQGMHKCKLNDAGGRPTSPRYLAETGNRLA
jgi:hypothetical protein